MIQWAQVQKRLKNFGLEKTSAKNYSAQTIKIKFQKIYRKFLKFQNNFKMF